MKYRWLLRFLRVLVYVKRGLWWVGGSLAFVLVAIFRPGFRLLIYFNYKLNYLLKRLGFAGEGNWVLKRDNLQIIVFVIMLFTVLPQTTLFAKKDNTLYGQKTLAFNLFSSEEDYSLEEVNAVPEIININNSSWRQGAIGSDFNSGLAGDVIVRDQENGYLAGGGNALLKPTMISGGVDMVSRRTAVVEYQVQPGDYLSGIAYQFGVSVATVMWENNLSLRSVLKLGQVLRIPPTTGVMHTIKKGDSIKKIAKLYGANESEIIKFNNLQDNGSDIKVGERIVVPNGVMPQSQSIVRAPRSTPSINRPVAPAGSTQSSNARGFVWPSGVRMITQYFGWKHHGLDIAGPWHTPNYAAKAGTVVVSQCGWNSGYGCYVIIDHGGGVRTLYGHNDVLLVSPGDQVSAGQTIGLMGNTGNVRGITGIHLHFEVRINNVTVNPLGYVR